MSLDPQLRVLARYRAGALPFGCQVRDAMRCHATLEPPQIAPICENPAGRREEGDERRLRVFGSVNWARGKNDYDRIRFEDSYKGKVQVFSTRMGSENHALDRAGCLRLLREFYDGQKKDWDMHIQRTAQRIEELQEELRKAEAKLQEMHVLESSSGEIVDNLLEGRSDS